MRREINELVKSLQKKKLTLALAESATCGLAASKLATCKGTSEILKGAIICYSPEVKNKILGVPKKMLERYTPESMEVTEKLAKNLSKLFDADIYAAITGLAAEGGSETKEKPVGTVFLCIKYENKMIKERKVFKGSPLQIRTKACIALFELIVKEIVKKEI
jgi:nicotinamide-nucleotide amidase